VNNRSETRNRHGVRQGNARLEEHPDSAQATPEESARFLEARKQVAQASTVSLRFSRLASRTAHWVGHPIMFILAVAVLVIWAVSGPFFHFSDTWQLIINTGTTIVTFLVVFLIQNTQNRDAKAFHLKLDELIRSHQPARNDMIDIEKLSDEELDEMEKRYAAICEENKARKARKQSAQQSHKNKPAA
jgi:low affinity Fe/Cu permease